MKSLRRLQSGYTVTEVLVVFAISVGLFLTVMTGFGVQNNRTEFNQAVRELEVRIQDILNDVATGYYPNAGNIKCERKNSGFGPEPQITPAVGNAQGTNNQCIFIGRAFDFRNVDNDQTDEIFTIVGLTHSLADVDEKNLSVNVDDASNRAIVNNAIVGAVDPFLRHGSMQISKVADMDTGAALNGFAIISGFGQGDGISGGQPSIAKIDHPFDFNSPHEAVVDAGDLGKTITLCIQETGAGPEARKATIKIGDGSLANIQTTIDATDTEWADGRCA